MLAEALSQIIGHSHIALTSRGQALNKINVVQVEPPFAQASEGVLLRANEYPILRSASAKQDGWGGIRTPGAFRHTRFPGVHNQPLCHPSKTIFRFL